MTEQTGTPAEHVRAVLARVRNPFEISDDVLAQLDTAVVHLVELRSLRYHSAPPPALRSSSHRHVFLLPDGCGLTLWELRYDSVGERQSEIYADESALRRSEQRIHQGHDTGTDIPFPAGPHEELPGGRQREYSGSGSPEHARRLLRRAENPDCPGSETLRLLSTARGHEISWLPRSRVADHPRHVWCSLYEHAFLLADGREVSLYELEHNVSGEGLLVSEVYARQDAAENAARLRAREQR